MTFKSLMLGAAAAALVATGAIAQDTDTETEPMPEAEAGAEASAEAGTDAAPEEGASEESVAEGETEADPTAEEAPADMAEGDAPADPLAGEAPAGDMAADGGMGTAGETMEPVGPQFSSFEEMTVGDVVGLLVRSPEDERIGEIDYVIQPAGGLEAVIGIGGFLGLGEYTVAIPLEDFELVDGGASLSLATDKETLKSQPEFDESGVEGIDPEVPIADLM